MSQQEDRLLEARQLLEHLGLPEKQTNDRSGWVLLALAAIQASNVSWANLSPELLTTRDIMDFIRDEYGMNYKPNSRETIRRQTLHQFEQACLVARNVDDPERPTNSAKNNYSLTEDALKILREYPQGSWKEAINSYHENVQSLKDEYARHLEMHKIEVKLPGAASILLSPGAHNQLHADIVHEFLPRFAKKGKVIYIGDTASSRNEGGKMLHLDEEAFDEINIPPLAHDKLPDVVYLDKEQNWLFLIEAVTSHGPVSEKRYKELEEQLADCSVGKVYVTAFPDSKTFRKDAADIAWETEVWIADRPDHMIHFNGDRFLGPRPRL